MSSETPPENFDSPRQPPMRGTQEEPVVAQAVPGLTSRETEFVPPPSSGEGCKWIAIGCGVTALVLLIVAGAVGIWVYANANRLVAKSAVTFAEGVIEEMDLPPEQEEQMVKRIGELGDQYAEGEITLEDLGEVAEKLVENDVVITSGIVYLLEEQVLEQAPIDDALREELKRTMGRLARGVVEERLELEDLKSLIDGIVTETPDGIELDPDVSQEDFTELLESARKIADDAEIPDEPYEVDFMSEVNEVIDEVLAK